MWSKISCNYLKPQLDDMDKFVALKFRREIAQDAHAKFKLVYGLNGMFANNVNNKNKIIQIM